MPTNYTIVGDGDITFSTDDVGYTAVGTILSGSQKRTGDLVELKDRQGNVFATIYFNDKDECEIEALWISTYTPPARGDLISIMGLTNVEVQDWEKKWENERETKFSLRCTKYRHKTITP